jgi:hypothetical protein
MTVLKSKGTVHKKDTKHYCDKFTKYVDLKMPAVDVKLEYTAFVVLSLGLTSGTFKDYLTLLNRLYDITWLRSVYD